MTSEHLSEEDLQLFAAGNLKLTAGMNHHLDACSFCREELDVYRVLYSAINKAPDPVFDFNLAETVLSRLKPIPPKTYNKNIYGFVPVAVVAIVVMISLYKFRKNFINLSAGISFTFLAISIVACIIIIGFKIVKEFHRHRLQISKLNYSE